MNKFLYLIFGLIFISIFLFTAMHSYLTRAHLLDPQAMHHSFVIMQAHHLIGFDLEDPEQAPLNIRDSVLRGYRLIMNTPFYAPNYARDQLSCANCHFFGGDTLGRKNEGISLVGVTAIYPRYSEREGQVISLVQRINSCFERSLNGRPLPENSQEMHDIVNYLTWISKEVSHLKNIPWLGLELLKSQHEPNAENGKQVYETYCAMCHKQDGQGGGALAPMGKTIPPLWGPNSFNDGAGMSHLPKFASFVYENMPYQDANLTEEEALDVAAFVLQQPRAHFQQN